MNPESDSPRPLPSSGRPPTPARRPGAMDIQPGRTGPVTAYPRPVAAAPQPEAPPAIAPPAATAAPQPFYQPPVAHATAPTPAAASVVPLAPPPAEASQARVHGLFKTIASVIVFLAVVIGSATLLNTFIFQSYYVDGTSMVPTLQNNDRLIISKVEKTTAAVNHRDYIPSRGQIIVIDSSVSAITRSRNEQIIKRVIGLPGDTVHIHGGIVTIINSQHPAGFNVDSSLGLHLEPTYLDTEMNDVSVPPGSVFVLGDNRGPGGSYDSRFFGPVTTDKIVGRLWLRVLPLAAMGVF